MMKKIQRSALKSPSLPKLDAQPSDIADLLDEDAFSHVVFNGTDFSHQEVKELLFEEVRLSNVKFSGTVFDKLSLLDARLETCDLSNADWHASKLMRVELDNC